MEIIMARRLAAKFIIYCCVVLSANAAIAGKLGEGDLNTYFGAWSASDVDKIMAYFGDGIVYEDVTTGDLSSGRDEVRAFVQKFLEGTPGVKLAPSNTIITNSKAAIEWTMSAGTGDDAWEVRGVSIMEHKNGEIIRVTDYWND